MSERNINRLKKRLMRIAMISFTIVMFFMGGLIYLGNLLIVRNEVYVVLNAIAENEGEMPNYDIGYLLSMSSDDAISNDSYYDYEGQNSDDGESLSQEDIFVQQLEQFFGFQNSYLTREYMYSTRFFAVIFPEDTNATPEVKTTYIASVNEEDAITYATVVQSRFRNFGRYGDYYYLVKSMDSGSTIVVIMDCTSQVAITNRILSMALIIIGFGVILSWMIMRKLSERMVQPEIENAELQKQFITNASHELKTPLAVIRANTELTEAISGRTEWTEATLRQVDRLQGLIQNLVLITRGQEHDQKGERGEIDLSKAIGENVETFRPVASQDGKNLMTDIPDGIVMKAEEGQMRQLTSLLVDNAIKYCDENGTIKVTLTKTRKLVTLMVSNDYKAGESVDCSKFFNRFYREDASHNTDKEGYGIGLSIAESIVSSYVGTIDASWKDGVITFTCRLIG